MRNKKGWIRIVEAFVSILLIAGVLLIVIGEKHIINPNPDSDIHDSQLIALRDIQMNTTLREKVLGASPPVESDKGGFPEEVKDRIDYLIPDSLECKSKICEIDLACGLDSQVEENIYVQSVIITVAKDQTEPMNPKQLKLFCWTN